MVFLVLSIVVVVALLVFRHLFKDYMAILEDVETIHREYPGKQNELSAAKKSCSSATALLSTQK